MAPSATIDSQLGLPLPGAATVLARERMGRLRHCSVTFTVRMDVYSLQGRASDLLHLFDNLHLVQIEISPDTKHERRFGRPSAAW